VEAQLQQAQLREEQQKQALATLYSGLQISELPQLPMPLKTEQSHSYWVDQIMDDNHELELAKAEAAVKITGVENCCRNDARPNRRHTRSTRAQRAGTHLRHQHLYSLIRYGS
jgi:hypothetical protein